jgi:hypothetical protein
MSCFTGFLSSSNVLVFWDYRLIRCPEIGEAVTGTIRKWNGFPQAATRLFASISHGVSYYLAGLATQSYPDPRLIRLFQHK